MTALHDDIVIKDANILIVDDTPQNIDILVETLGGHYSLQVALDGNEALEAVNESIPDLILLDIVMPGIDGFEVCRQLKSDERTSDIPVIFLTAIDDIGRKKKGFELGAVDYITKPFDVEEVTARVETHLSVKIARDVLKNQMDTLEKMVLMRTREIVATQDVTIRMAASLAETRDNETGNHIIRTQRYIKVLSERLADCNKFTEVLDNKGIDLIVKSAALHDIGKIGVPDNILLKPGKLHGLEFETMKKHTIYGFEALTKAEQDMEADLRQKSFLRYAKEIAYCHHEKWDGTGYPQGLRGESIPVSGRLMAIADVYDALISRRVYKEPFPHARACSIIVEGRGTHFDPEIVECFISLQDEFLKIALELLESDEARQVLLL